MSYISPTPDALMTVFTHTNHTHAQPDRQTDRQTGRESTPFHFCSLSIILLVIYLSIHFSSNIPHQLRAAQRGMFNKRHTASLLTSTCPAMSHHHCTNKHPHIHTERDINGALPVSLSPMCDFRDIRRPADSCGCREGVQSFVSHIVEWHQSIAKGRNSHGINQ